MRVKGVEGGHAADAEQPLWEEGYPPGLEYVTFALKNGGNVHEIDLVADHGDITPDDHLVSLKALGSLDPIDREFAILSIVENENVRALPALQTLAFWDPEEAVRLQAISALGEVKDRSSIEILRQLIQIPFSPPPPSTLCSERVELTHAHVVEHSSPPSTEYGEKIQAAALLALEKLGEAESLPTTKLLQIIRKYHTGSNFPEKRSSLLNAALTVIEHRTIEHEDRREAVVASILKSALGKVFLQDQEACVAAALRVDRAYTTTELESRLFSARSSSHNQFKIFNLLLFAYQDSPGNRIKLVNAAVRISKNRQVREKAIRLAEAPWVLIGALNDKDTALQEVAADRLARFKGMAIYDVKAVAEKLSDRKASVRIAASRALLQIRDNTAAIPYLINALSASSPIVRGNSATALGNNPERAMAYLPSLVECVERGHRFEQEAALDVIQTVAFIAPDDNLLRKLQTVIEDRRQSFEVRMKTIRTTSLIGGYSGANLLFASKTRLEPELRELIERELREGF
ncbi:HEAT repeat domain-containing protein [Oligoflexia bacterium]|nr:HEAT repeat domain-containing protein [Oligoflexia bacterium]